MGTKTFSISHNLDGCFLAKVVKCYVRLDIMRFEALAQEANATRKKTTAAQRKGETQRRGVTLPADVVDDSGRSDVGAYGHLSAIVDDSVSSEYGVLLT